MQLTNPKKMLQGQHLRTRLWRIDEEALDEFEGQYLVDFGGVVTVSFEVSLNYCLKPVRFEIWPRKTAWVQEHVANIAGEDVPVPDPKMVELVPSEKNMLEA